MTTKLTDADIAASVPQTMPPRKKGLKVEFTDWQVEVIHQALLHYQDEAKRLGWSPLAKQQLADLATKMGGDWRLPVVAKF